MKKAHITQYSSDDDSNGSSDEGFSQLENSDMETGGLRNGQGDDSLDGENESDPETENRAEDMRRQLADVPFNQLIRMQKQVRSKKANKAMGLEQKLQRRKEVLSVLKPRLNEMAGDRDSSEESLESDSDSDSDSDSAPETAPSAANKGKRMSNGNTTGKHRRSDKNKPTIMSSKWPVGRFRQVVEIPKATIRDPRFDSLSGNFNEDLYEKTYAFLDDQQKNEMEFLEKQAQKLKNSDPDEARRVQMALGSMKSQVAAKNQKKKQQELKRKHRKMELDAAQHGKKPYFLKKRELKDLEAAEKFSKLKDSSKLNTYLEKRRKRNASKEHRRMPYQRRDE
ncbi:rRNA biogenesis protein rrp36 [Coemansia sp. RSA 2559]|nr:rRNA biogenesis protein rrp36 [Coemansia sp. RSA 2559]KAJ2868776.1 rRNA biogenesis protein rrp36 [Coemansia erecta]